MSSLQEAAKEIFNANIATKKGERDGGYKGGAVGQDKLKAAVAYGEKEVGLIGQSPEEDNEPLPNYLKGTPTATPPGATPPVGSEKRGVGYTKPGPSQGDAGTPMVQPQETMGRTDLKQTKQRPATSYEKIRDREAYDAPEQTFTANPGAHFQSYGEEIDLTDDVKALLEGESLSDEFKTKATTIFEAAVKTRIQQIAEQIQTDLSEQFDDAVEIVKQELSEKVSDYMDYMVEEWMKANELAIEKGLRAEIVEEFIAKLRNLFVESYIDIPEDKVDVIEELTERVEELEEKLNESIKTNIAFSKQVNEHKKLKAVMEACDGLTQTQEEKLKTLADSVEYTTPEEFVEKLETLKENYFPSKTKTATTDTLNEEVQIEEDPNAKKKSGNRLMDIYSDTISKSVV